MSKNHVNKNVCNGRVTTSQIKQIVTLDKLILKFTTDRVLNVIDKISEGLYLKEIEKFEAKNRNRQLASQYKYCSLVFFKGVDVASIYYSKKLGEETKGVIRFKNNTFYTNLNEFYINLITSDRLQLKNVNVFKLDIAFDVNNKGYLKELNKHYIKYSSKKIKLYKGTKFKEEEPKYSYYIGTNKYINIYDKIAELKSSRKNYIVDYYKQNSFDMKKGVTRLELRLNKYNGGFIARITREIDLLRILDIDYIGNIAKEVFDTKLWYFKDDNLNRSRRTRKRLLEIDYGSYKKEVNYSSTTILKAASDREKKKILKILTLEWLNDTGGEDADNEQYKRLKKKVKLLGLEEWYSNYITGTDFSREFKEYKELYC